MSNYWPHILEYSEQRIGKAVLPFGWHHGALLMDADGKVYEYDDDFLYQVGASPEDAIEGLVAGRDALEHYDEDVAQERAEGLNAPLHQDQEGNH